MTTMSTKLAGMICVAMSIFAVPAGAEEGGHTISKDAISNEAISKQAKIAIILGTATPGGGFPLYGNAFAEVMNAADPTLSIEKVRQFKELMEEDHEGAWNAYKTLYVGGGADPVVVGRDFKQLDFAATQGKGESRLAASAGVPPSWVGFSEGLQGSSLNAGNFNAARRRFSDGTMMHLWSNAAASLESLVTLPDAGASLWFDTRAAAFMREDAGELASIQSKQANTIAALVREGFTAKSAVDAVDNNDWGRLQHTGLTSVQLLPPSDGQEPIQGENVVTPEGAGP